MVIYEFNFGLISQYIVLKRMHLKSILLLLLTPVLRPPFALIHNKNLKRLLYLHKRVSNKYFTKQKYPILISEIFLIRMYVSFI